ncbi:hypothetical protein [Azonexus sp.]|jgi:hypothetical protein|uniref:hypothetical protein n=1 Tax=Azonexus sp. TaxID=1872668 RepID=UPI0035B27C37
MSFCQPCRVWMKRHEKATRWVAFFIGLSLFFTLLGLVTDPVYMPGLCKVYP